MSARGTGGRRVEKLSWGAVYSGLATNWFPETDFLGNSNPK